jgi:hypothetical protein
VELLCFCFISSSTEKTVSFFRIFPDAATARDFRNFLSNQTTDFQNLFILFFSSGLRWRFFEDSSLGRQCPLCKCSFWSWEHFCQCPATHQRLTLFHEVSEAAFYGNWLGLVSLLQEILGVWLRAVRGRPTLLSLPAVDRVLSSVR